MREITSIEIGRAVEELRDRLTGSRLRKFYDLGEGSFRFLFYKKEGSAHVYCKLLRTFNETKFTEGAEGATTFAMGIRKRLENSTLTSILQYDSDRMIVLEFGKDNYRLVIEMFGKGNMVLTTLDGKIELCYKVIRYRDRTVAPGNSYELPKSGAVPLGEVDLEKAGEIVRAAPTDKKLIRYLSDRINVGPLYLEDIIIRSGLDPGGILDNREHDEALAENIVGFFRRISEEKPRIYRENGLPKDYAIASVARYEGVDHVEYDTLNELLDELFINERSEVFDKENNEQKERIISNIEAQKQLAVSTVSESSYYSRAGNKIFENMQMINSIIAYLQKNKNAKLDEVRKAFGGIKIKELDLKNKIVNIDLED